MDMEQPRAWVEHPEHGSKMIYLDERDKYLACGWNRPGQPSEPQLDLEEPVEEAEEPEDKKLSEMTKDELNDFAAVNTPGIKITSRMSLGAIRSKILKALNDDSA